MASIQGYLAQLEARLAPSLDAHDLQERLTEAEVHLRDRAQEFEEIGLPPVEAEARAVAAFGDPEEFAEDAPVKVVPKEGLPSIRRPSTPPRDLALQLAWSSVGLGLVSMLTVDHSYWTAGGVAAAFLGIGALFGRPTTILRMALLATVASVVAYPVLLGFYEPTPHNAMEPERIGVRLRGQDTNMDYYYRQASQELGRFERARATFQKQGKVQMSGEKGFFGPASHLDEGFGAWPWRGSYRWSGSLSLEAYDTREEAAHRWIVEGEATHVRLLKDVRQSEPITPRLTSWERECRFALVAGAGGLAFLATMVGIQALALALRGSLAWIFLGLRRRPEERSRSYYGEPERS